MTGISGAWRRREDIAWIGDDDRVVAAATAPPDVDGPRILEGAAAWVWWHLAEPRTARELADGSAPAVFVEQALAALGSAGLIEPVP